VFLSGHERIKWIRDALENWKEDISSMGQTLRAFLKLGSLRLITSIPRAQDNNR